MFLPLLAGCLVQAQDGVPVVVARHDLAAGTPIGPDDVSVVMLAARGEGAFAAPAEVIGRTPRARVLTDEVVRAERLAAEGATAGVSALLAPGLRAVTLRLDDDHGWTPHLAAQDHVDVLWTETPDCTDTTPARHTAFVLRDVQILEVRGAYGEEKGGARWASRSDSNYGESDRLKSGTVTLALTPDGSRALAEAQVTGSIHLALRALGDPDTQRAPAIGIADLTGAP